MDALDHMLPWKIPYVVTIVNFDRGKNLCTAVVKGDTLSSACHFHQPPKFEMPLPNYVRLIQKQAYGSHTT